MTASAPLGISEVQETRLWPSHTAEPVASYVSFGRQIKSWPLELGSVFLARRQPLDKMARRKTLALI